MRKKVIDKATSKPVWIVLFISDGTKITTQACDDEVHAMDVSSELLGMDVSDDELVEVDENGWITPKDEASDVGVMYFQLYRE